MNRFQFIDTDPGVNLRGVEIAVAEHRLDEADVGAVLEHVRGHGVSKQMTRANRIDTGLGDVAFDSRRQGAASKALAFIRQEQGAVILAGCE